MTKLLKPDGGLITPEGQKVQPINNQLLSALNKMEVIEPEKIEPIQFRVLLRVADTKSITSGGVLKPVEVLEKEIFDKCTATLIAIGCEAFTGSNGEPLKSKPKIGQKVVIAKYSGLTMRDKDYNLYRFANDVDVVAIVRE